MERNNLFVPAVLWISVREELSMAANFWARPRCLLILELPAFIQAEPNKRGKENIEDGLSAGTNISCKF